MKPLDPAEARELADMCGDHDTEGDLASLAVALRLESQGYAHRVPASPGYFAAFEPTESGYRALRCYRAFYGVGS